MEGRPGGHRALSSDAGRMERRRGCREGMAGWAHEAGGVLCSMEGGSDQPRSPHAAETRLTAWLWTHGNNGQLDLKLFNETVGQKHG